MQAALLARIAPPAIAEAWCRARLASASDVYGTLPADLPLDALIERAQGS